ncbi:winged helix-turn-helix domain-containing protein [Cronobacter malonaticus]
MKTIRAKILAIMNVGMVLTTNEISRRTGNTLEAVRVVLNRMQKDGELTGTSQKPRRWRLVDSVNHRAELIRCVKAFGALTAIQASEITGLSPVYCINTLRILEMNGELTRQMVRTYASNGKKTRCYAYSPAPERKAISNTACISPFAKLITSRIGA